MTLKKIAKFMILVVIGISLVGCSDKKNTTTTQNNETTNSSIDTASYDRGYLVIPEEEVKDMEKMTCTRQGNGEDDSKVKLNYTLYYKGEYLQILHSIEQVISKDQDILDEYQLAYINIYKNYENLEYYETSVVREEDSITNDTVKSPQSIENKGKEDNIIKDGKVKLDDWLEFAEKFGTTCDKN